MKLERILIRILLSFLGICIGVILWQLTGEMLSASYQYGIVFLESWQTLIGAFVGAAAPLSIFLLTRLHYEQKDHLEKLEKVLVLAINNLVSVDDTIIKFLKGNLSREIDAVLQTPDGSYALGKTFFPLMHAFEFPIEVTSRSTSSNYLENLLIQSYALSKDFPHMVNDMRGQFDQIYGMQNNLIQTEILTKGAIRTDPNTFFKNQLTAYAEFIERDWSRISFPVYLKKLVSARTTLTTYRKLGQTFHGTRWQRKFGPVSFKYFRNSTEIEEYRKKGMERVDVFLKDSIERDFTDLLEQSASAQYLRERDGMASNLGPEVQAAL